MSSTDNSTFIQEFQAITGADEAKARLFGSNCNWSLEVGISNYFDNPNMHDIPPEIDPMDLNNPIPIFSQHANEIQVAPVDDPLDSKCGLYDKNKNRIPLRGIKCKAAIKDFVADVEIQQRFVNTQDNPIEAIFQFQQDESAIYSFEAEIDGKHIIGQCKDKQSAFAKYDDSIASGHGAYLLEQTEEGLFQLNIGNLPPHKDCILTIKYVTEMYAEGEAIKFYLPITKYAIYKDNTKEEEKEEKVADGVEIKVDVKVSSNIVGIESPSHVIDAKIDGKSASVTFQDNSYREAREFSLLIGIEEPHKVTASVEKYDTDHAVMVTFFPKIETQEEEDILTEIVFLVDRSGSMAGSRLNQAKNALQLFLRSLPEGTLFNIIGFGSTYEKLFPSSAVFNSESLRAATKHVQGMSANLAGTDIYSPLKDVFSYMPHEEYPRIVFCVTDGEVNNTSQILQLVKNSAGSTRVFTLGIGADASRYLVRGLAKAGHGTSEFVVSGERVEAKVLSQLKKALQPVYKHVRLDWGHLQVKAQSPKNIPPLFNGEKIVLYAMVDSLPQEDKSAITMKASTGTRDSTFIVDVDLTKIEENSLLNRLTCKNIIRELQHEDDQEKNKSEIIRLATKYGLVSKYTSIVAIEKRSEAVEGNIEQVQVNDIMTDIISGPIPTNIPSDPFVHPLPPQPILRSHSSSSVLDLSHIGSTISNTGYNLVQSISHKLDFLSPKSDDLEGSLPSPPPPAEPERPKPIAAARQSFGHLTSEIGSAFGDLKTSATSLFKEMMPNSPRREQEQQIKQQEIHFNEEEEVSFTDHMDMVLEEPAKEEAEEISKRKRKTSGPTLAFADNLFGLFKPASSPMTSHAHVNTTVNLSDPSQRPLDRVILLQQANGSWMLEAQLVGLMGLSMGEVTEALNKAFAEVDPTKKELLTNVWATALAVAFIEAKFAAQKEEWQMLTEKATKWIKRQMSELNTKDTTFFEAVKDLIK